LILLAIPFLVAVAVATGIGIAREDRVATLLPLVAVAGTTLLAFAAARFDLFVAAILAVRASLDAIKVGTSSVDATGALSVLFIGAAIVWLLARRDDRRAAPNPATAVLVPLTALFVAGVLSIGLSQHPLQSGMEAVRIGTLVVIVAVLGRLATDPRTARVLLVAIFASAIVPLTAAALQLSAGRGMMTAEGISRIRGTFLHPNPFAAYLFLLITLGVSLAPHVRWRWRLPMLAITAASGAVLVTTYARGAWAATLVALFVIGIVQDRRVLAVLAASVVVVALFVPSVAVRLSDLTTDQKETGATGNSLVWRLDYWAQVLALQSNPVTGIGLREVELNQAAEKAPHNDPIRVYVEMGLLGLSAYLWLFGALAIAARHAIRRAPPGMPRGLAVAFAAALTGLVLLSLSANVISQLAILWYFAAIVVLALAASRWPAPVPTGDPKMLRSSASSGVPGPTA
jgi:putative inorganic carbon (hco3(-)) transporter